MPMMPLSASGVSITRSSPKSFCRPSVTRKTPPSLPTSSPITRTFGSFSIAARRPALMAFAMVVCVLTGHPRRLVLEARPIVREPRPLLLDQRVPLPVGGRRCRRDRDRACVRHAWRTCAASAAGLGLHLVEERLVAQPAARQVRPTRAIGSFSFHSSTSSAIR